MRPLPDNEGLLIVLPDGTFAPLDDCYLLQVKDIDKHKEGDFLNNVGSGNVLAEWEFSSLYLIESPYILN